jgi:hypothetical protein
VEVANLAIAAALCGLIWTIQLVHYPLFALVGEAQWVAYGEAHRQRITWLVLPLMTANVAVAALHARLHGELAPRFAHDRLRLLVRLNWLRTAAWTVQVGVAVALAG